MSNPRCKLDRPERADYFRVFARHLLTDEDYEFLTREEWGSVFLLMLHQWAKGGALPDDPEKLAFLSRCSSVEEWNALVQKWPKLRPIPGCPGKVGIPYLVREWEQVAAFYAKQKARATKGAEARWEESAHKNAHGHAESAENDAHGHAESIKTNAQGHATGMPNKDQDKEVLSTPFIPLEGDAHGDAHGHSDETVAWFEKLWKFYAEITPPPAQGHVPSSSKAACRDRFRKITRSEKVTPRELAYSIQAHVEDLQRRGSFLFALATVIGTRRPMWREHLDTARAWIDEEKRHEQ